MALAQETAVLFARIPAEILVRDAGTHAMVLVEAVVTQVVDIQQEGLDIDYQNNI